MSRDDATLVQIVEAARLAIEFVEDHDRASFAAADDADLAEIYNTERHLLYVACTRARDHLLVTSVAPASEFLDDLRG
jgi:ATP-dependent exoDNAse (exonuclease V) beta subunit